MTHIGEVWLLWSKAIDDRGDYVINVYASRARAVNALLRLDPFTAMVDEEDDHMVFQSSDSDMDYYVIETRKVEQ